MACSGETFAVPEFLEEVADVAARRGFAVDKLAQCGPVPLLLLQRAAEVPNAPRLYLSAGIHGDEPAGSQALLDLLKEDFLPRTAEWTLLPLLNPEGMARKHRGNGADVDLNRDFKDPQTPEVKALTAWLQEHGGRYDLCLNLHEDWEAHGYYVYDPMPPGPLPIARIALAAAQPVCGIDHSPVIDGWDARTGVITPPINPDERPEWPETLYLFDHHTDLAFTFETPSSRPLAERAAAHAAALRAVLPAFLDKIAASA